MYTPQVGSVGPKQVVRAENAVCAAQHPIVTETILQVLRNGGNAVDACIAGCLVQATIQQEMTNHTGTVTFLYYEARTGKYYSLNSSGTLVPGLAPFRPIPPGGFLSQGGRAGVCACIPGFMPGMQALYERFATRPWASLCEAAIYWAEEGHPVSSLELRHLEEELGFWSYFPSGREHFMPDGFLPNVGDRFRKPKLAQTLRRLADEGPDYFTTGGWARHFVEAANRLGWPINLADMTRIPPRWQAPLRYTHKGREIVQLAPPERTGIFSAIVLGVLGQFDLAGMGHFAENPEVAYLWAHTLRWAHWQCGLLQDPDVFDVPVDQWLSREYHAMVADILWRSRPKADLTDHVRAVAGAAALAAGGMDVAAGAGGTPPRPHIEDHTGSCEISIIDRDGNCVQMMNTLQSGGIPGMVVDGVAMTGSSAQPTMSGIIAGWFAGGGRIRSVIGNSFILKEGKPWICLGTPGNCRVVLPQVLSNILDYGMEPYEAAVAPRMDWLLDDYTVEVESRLSAATVAGLARMGILVKPLPPFCTVMGSFQMCWQPGSGSRLAACSDPRREGSAGGF